MATTDTLGSAKTARQQTVFEIVAKALLQRADEIRDISRQIDCAADRMFGSLQEVPTGDEARPSREGYAGALEDAVDSLHDSVNALSNAGARITARI